MFSRLRRHMRGRSALALGAYTACLDLALGVGTPALGAVAAHWGLGSVFLVSTVVVASAAVIGLSLLAGARAADANAARRSTA